MNPTRVSVPRYLPRTLRRLALGFSLAATLGLRAAEPRPDLLVADFEGPTYGAWTTTGEAFGTGPAQGTLPGQMAVTGFEGRGLVNSFLRGDGTTGTLTSPPFVVEREYLQFLIGGGGFAGQTCLNLLLDGEVVRTETGPNTQSGGSESLERREWRVADLAGRRVVLQVVDRATGGWGHLNVDHILQTDRRLPGVVTNATRELVAQSRYLHLPVRTGAPKRQVTVLSEGTAVRQFEIELADRSPEWWAFLDLEPFRGRTLQLRVDRLPEDSGALAAIVQGDILRDAEDLYRESLRPQFHFSSRRGWNNDPNGLVFHQGEYHLFYQHNPYGWAWGNMHWGHAVSRDLVRWEELPVALYPDRHGTMFSGSAVVDWENTAGFQTGAEKALVCIFTAAGKPFTQGLAYSNDRGRTWTKYEGNPVLGHLAGDNRDPKVFWYAPQRKWVMALYLDGSDFALFSSPDLKRWERLSDVSIPGTSECPEFFEIPVEGAPGEARWIFYGGNGRYLVGRFDGRRFTTESGPHPLHHGNAWYASQTYNDIPASDGRRILIAWGQVNLPDMPFNQMMGLPVALTLHRRPEGLRLAAQPVAELRSLRTQTLDRPGLKAGPEAVRPFEGIPLDLFELEAEFSPEAAATVTFRLRGVPLVYDAARAELVCGDRRAPLAARDGRVRLHVFVDRASIDAFGNDGQAYLPMGARFPSDSRDFSVASSGGSATFQTLNLHVLRSAWRRP